MSNKIKGYHPAFLSKETYDCFDANKDKIIEDLVNALKEIRITKDTTIASKILQEYNLIEDINEQN